jgi:hypothetical protein
MAGIKYCPKCRLVNTPEAERCDCGWDFETRRQERSYLEPKQRLPVAASIGGVVLALIVFRLLLVMFRAAAN